MASDPHTSSGKTSPDLGERGPEASRKPEVHDEIVEMLAKLGDPDEGKTDEERAAIDKALLRRIDLWLIPWLSLIYLMSFLDRTNIGNARLAGMEEELGMSGLDYNVSLSIFFIGYAFAEPITNAILKRSSPRKFFTAIVILWGIIMALNGLCTNYRGLLAARFFLGVAEAGLFPGCNFYLSCWYRPMEVGLRSSIFFSAAALAGAFAGLLAAAIALMDDVAGVSGWAWIFILEGIATVVVGLFCWWMIFDWPETARFLSPEDRIRCQRRLLLAKQGRVAEDADKRHAIAAVKDWKTYGYMLIFSGCLCPLYAFALFLPTILQNMGYSGTKSQLLSVPPYATGAIVTVIVGYVSDKTRKRALCNAVPVTLAIIGFVMLIASPNSHVQYAGTFLGAMGIYPTIPNTLAWVNNNTEGSLKRAVVIGLVVGFGNLNGVVSSNIYMVEEKPRYYTGHGVVLGYLCSCIMVGSICMHLGLRAENKNREQGRMDAQWEGMSEEEKKFAGDKRPNFRYTL